MTKYRTTMSLMVVMLAWSLLALWQWREYVYERQMARGALERHARSIAATLIGGIRSHRRMGRFFEQQLQATLDGLVEAEDIEAVAVADAEGRIILSAGENHAPFAPQRWPHSTVRWLPEGLCYVCWFTLDPAPQSGAGAGGGRGFRRGRPFRWEPAAEDFSESVLAAGGRFCVVVLVKRNTVDAQLRRAAQARVGLVAAGGLVIACLVVAWWAAIRAANARGQLRLLQAETQHLRQLHQSATGLAHETRNPLGVIRGWAQQLSQAENLTEKQREQAALLLEECDRLTWRINQFLCFARPREPSPQTVRLGELVGELVTLLQPDLEAKQLQVRVEPANDNVEVYADRELLRQALFNLLSNAIVFSPQKGTIEVTMVRQPGGKWRVEVADSGPGVPESERQRLFLPYHTTRPQGTGLGLAIVRQIALAHHWEVGYDSRNGGGAVFWIERISSAAKARG